MKVAVPYEAGAVYQHFGHAAQFKLYEVENNQIVSSSVVDTEGSGHGAVTAFLKQQGADTVICGGIGAGAMNALKEAGIPVCGGVSGDADEAVEALIAGELEYTDEAGCDHDHHHGGQEHCGDEGCHAHCGGHCGGGRPAMEGKNVGKKVRVHYRGTFNDGTQFDSSYDRGQTLDFVCGAGQMIAGFDAAVAVMEVGEAVDIHLMPEEAYGAADPEAIFQVPIAQLPGSEQLEVGQQVYLTNVNGQQFPVKVVEKDEENITFDANHEMAGKELNFHIELIEAAE